MTLLTRVSPLYQVHQYNSNNSLNSRYKKASSFLTRLRCVGGAAGLASQRDSRPRVRCINTIPTTDLNFRYKKAPSMLTRLRCIGGTAGLAFQRDSRPRVRCTNTIPTTKFQIQKSPVISDEASLCWRNGWAGTPAGLSTLCQVLQYNSNNSLNSRYKKAPSFLTRLRCIGGADRTRTRDPRRDRPVF